MKKNLIRQYIDHFNIYDLFSENSTPLAAAKFFLELHEQCILNGNVNIDIHIDKYDDDISIYGYREETDKEYNARIRKINETELKERELLQQLKEKYENVGGNNE